MQEYGEVENNVDLKIYNTYKIGGRAKYLVKPYDKNKLLLLLKYLRSNNIKYFIIGKGSNIILPDENYDGVIILLNNLNKIDIKDNIVYAEAGIPLTILVQNLVNNNLGGLENLSGIPGTLGGAIVQNAGCYNTLISDYLEEVTCIINNEIKTIKKEECNFLYRDSIFKYNKNMIIIGAKFKLIDDDKERMLSIIKENMQKRKNSQPLMYPNAGSVFRNPSNISAGKLIEDALLKGYHINGAYVSTKHANFIINKDNATSEDIINLINYIKKEIKNKYNIDLILEQEIIKYSE